MKNEEWKSLEILGFSNYKVSNLGRVFNILTKKYLNGFDNGKGYKQVSMRNDNGEAKAPRRARLVAIMFVYNDNPKEKYFVDHIDGTRDNDIASNLRWVTASENMLNPVTRVRASESRKGKHLSEEHKVKLSIVMTGNKNGCGNKGKTSHAKGRHRYKDENGRYYYK